MNLAVLLKKTGAFNVTSACFPLRRWSRKRGVPVAFKIEPYFVRVKNKTLRRLAVYAKLSGVISTSELTSYKIFPKKTRDGVWWKILSDVPANFALHANCFRVSSNRLYYAVPRGFIAVWRFNKRGSVFFSLLPKTISTDADFFQAMGAFKGEMLTSGGNAFVFANSNPVLVNLTTNFLKKLGASPSEISYYLEVCGSHPEVSDAVKWWRSRLTEKLPVKLRVRLRPEFAAGKKRGTLHVIYNDRLFREVVEALLRYAEKTAERDAAAAAEYLKGLIAAEGNVNTKKRTRRLYMVRISAKKRSDRIHYKKVLETVGLNITARDMPSVSGKEGVRRGWKTRYGRAGCVIITKVRDFTKLFELNAFELDDEKRVKFVRGVCGMKTVRNNLLEYAEMPAAFTLKQAREKRSLKNNPYAGVKQLLALGLVASVRGCGKSDDPRVFKLTRLGRNVIELMDNASN